MEVPNELAKSKDIIGISYLYWIVLVCRDYADFVILRVKRNPFHRHITKVVDYICLTEMLKIKKRGLNLSFSLGLLSLIVGVVCILQSISCFNNSHSWRNGSNTCCLNIKCKELK